jgi:3-dehydroquinate dehydratase-2
MKVLVIQGAGMDRRGKAQVEVFGPETLEEINRLIEDAARALAIEVEIFFDNDEAKAAQKLRDSAAGIDGLLINPAGFTACADVLRDAVAELEVPVFEVHGSNPSARGVESVFRAHCTGAVCGFGYGGYSLALRALRDRSQQA